MSSVDCCGKSRFGERLFEYNGVWLQCQDAATIAGDENVRDDPAKLNLFDGGNPTAFMEPSIDDEHVRLMMFCCGNRLVLGSGKRAYFMPHGFEHVGQKQTDKAVIFHDKDKKRLHIISSRQLYLGNLCTARPT